MNSHFLCIFTWIPHTNTALAVHVMWFPCVLTDAQKKVCLSQKGCHGAASNIFPAFPLFLEFIFHSLSFNIIHVQLYQQRLRAA